MWHLESFTYSPGDLFACDFYRINMFDIYHTITVKFRLLLPEFRCLKCSELFKWKLLCFV
ncbi:hypothetical protein C0J52_18959 [Blattella germanica]|nr:hypothetical protein C0J52_18959 [Blattella germanica]